MPIQSCSQDGKSGYQYGKHGKCYTHDGSDASKKNAKKKAIKQGLAEQYNGGHKFEGALFTPEDLEGISTGELIELNVEVVIESERQIESEHDKKDANS